MGYEWAKGASAAGDPNLVGKELESLPKVTIDSVLDKARDPSTELHKCFLWDDTEAAEKYRRHQASMIICTIKKEIKSVDSTQPSIIARAYESIKSDPLKKSEYVFTETAIQEVDKTAMILGRIVKDIISLQKSLNDYKSILTPEVRKKVEDLLEFFI